MHKDATSKKVENICWVWIPSIIKYLEPSTRDMFTARFVDYHFDESNFPTTGGENKQLNRETSWNELSLSHFDPRTK